MPIKVMVLELEEQQVKQKRRSTWLASDLIRHARENPPQPIIDGLIYEGDILLLHGPEECFKSVFILQMAESIALGAPFLRYWDVPQSRTVGVIETELHEVMLGERLGKMFRDAEAPDNLKFWAADRLPEWRREDMGGKFKRIQNWIDENGIQVLAIDTANDFFRGAHNPADERHAGAFFDELRNLRVRGRIIVRHDRKRREDEDDANPNERIRGSGEWKEDPEVIVSLTRMDHRTNEVRLDVGKMRYGRKPGAMALWFDAGSFRLTPLPVIAAILESGPRTRQQLLNEAAVRFGLADRKVDELIANFKPFLIENRMGHQKRLELDLPRAAESQWGIFLKKEGA